MASVSALQRWSKISRTSSSTEEGDAGKGFLRGEIEKMERWQLELAESNLRVAEDCFARWGGLERAHNVIKARCALESARTEFRQDELDAACFVASAVAEHCNELLYRPFLAEARQSH